MAEFCHGKNQFCHGKLMRKKSHSGVGTLLVRCRAIVYDTGQHLNGIRALYTMCMHSHQHEVPSRAE